MTGPVLGDPGETRLPRAKPYPWGSVFAAVFVASVLANWPTWLVALGWIGTMAWLACEGLRLRAWGKRDRWEAAMRERAQHDARYAEQWERERWLSEQIDL